MNMDYVSNRIKTLVEERDALVTLLQVELPCTHGANHVRRLLESKLQDIEHALEFWFEELEEEEEDNDFVEDEPEVKFEEPLTEEELKEYFK